MTLLRPAPRVFYPWPMRMTAARLGSLGLIVLVCLWSPLTLVWWIATGRRDHVAHKLLDLAAVLKLIGDPEEL